MDTPPRIPEFTCEPIMVIGQDWPVGILVNRWEDDPSRGQRLVLTGSRVYNEPPKPQDGPAERPQSFMDPGVAGAIRGFLDQDRPPRGIPAGAVGGRMVTGDEAHSHLDHYQDLGSAPLRRHLDREHNHLDHYQAKDPLALHADLHLVRRYIVQPGE